MWWKGNVAPRKDQETAEAVTDEPKIDDLEVEMQKILDEDDRLGKAERQGKAEVDEPTEEEPADSDESEETVSASKTPTTDELLAQMAEDRRALRETQDQLRQALQLLSEQSAGESVDNEDEVNEEIPYDIGDLPDDAEELREVLNRVGRASSSQVRALERKINSLVDTQQRRLNEIETSMIRVNLKVSKAEEDAIVEWAKNKGRVFRNGQELVSVIEDYRDAQELEGYRRKSKETASPPREKLGNTKGRQISKDANEALEDAGMSAFDRAYLKARKQHITRLQRGELF